MGAEQEKINSEDTPISAAQLLDDTLKQNKALKSKVFTYKAWMITFGLLLIGAIYTLHVADDLLESQQDLIVNMHKVFASSDDLTDKYDELINKYDIIIEHQILSAPNYNSKLGESSVASGHPYGSKQHIEYLQTLDKDILELFVTACNSVSNDSQGCKDVRSVFADS